MVLVLAMTTVIYACCGVAGAEVDVADWERVGDRTQQWLNLRYVGGCSSGSTPSTRRWC